MTSKVEQKQQTHESILQSAARLLREKGVSGARVMDVMKGAGLTVGFLPGTALTDTVFPAICHNRARAEPVRIWVPACASGEEVYSLAMLWLEFLGDRGLDLPLQIFGTDLSEKLKATV